MGEPICIEPEVSTGDICPARTPGTLGVNDQADPHMPARLGATPGTTGVNDLGAAQADAPACFAEHHPITIQADSTEDTISGSATLVGTGIAAIARIPVPGEGKLFIELRPRGFVPKSGSTSTLFIQDATGKKHLRLDYGYNKVTGKVDYHWNQKGTFDRFGITDHTPAGPSGEALYKGAKYFKYGGRVLLIVGIAADLYSIVVARKRLRQVVIVVSGWSGAWAGCELLGSAGAAGGTAIEPGGGTAIGGFLGCVAGGIGGYWGASWVASKTYDWVEETYFEPLPETNAP